MIVSIPFIAGQWSLLRNAVENDPDLRVSIPFIAGQWSLLGLLARWFLYPTRLNPLHCGAVVASKAGVEQAADHAQYVSIPFIAGQWSLLPRTTPLSFCGVRLRKRRLPCDHIICTRLPF